MHDFRLAVRALRATPVVSIVAALSLALGIGANTAIFSLVNSLLLRPLPVADPHRLVTISTPAAIDMGFKAGLGWSYAMWQRLAERADAFDGAFVWMAQRVDLAQGGEMQPATALFASGDFFRTLGVRAMIGRAFTAADDVRGGGPDGAVAVISHGLWQRRFGGAADVVGKSIVLEGTPFTIVGVTPPEFLGLEIGRSFDVVAPLGTEALIRGPRSILDSRAALMLIAMLRLKAGQSLDEGSAAIRTLQPQILEAGAPGGGRLPKFLMDPFTLVPAATGTSGTEPGIPGLRQRYERSLLTIFAIVALVLIVAAMNIANLLLARATARRYELSVRRALGAPRWRLARQLLTESLVLASGGAVAGIALAAWGSRAIVARIGAPAGRIELDQSLDWRVMAFTIAVTCGTALVFGIAPAFRAARVDPIDAMKQQGRGLLHSSRLRLASGLVVAQVALSLVLVAAAGLFIRTLTRLSSVPLGFDAGPVLLVTVDTTRVRMDPSARPVLFARLVERVRTVPGVVHAGASAWTPLGGGAGTMGVGLPDTAANAATTVLVNAVTSGWFSTYGTALRAGRDLDARDTSTSPPVVVVNEAFARKFLPGRGAVGETIVRSPGRPSAVAATIVGIVGDQLVAGGYRPDGSPRSLRDGASPAMFVPLAQASGIGPPGRASITIGVRTASGPPSAVAPSIAAALTGVDRDVAFVFRPLADQADAALQQERLVAMLAGAFGALALLLAGLGLYGLTSYVVARRRSEIGIRLALGAPPSSAVRHVFGGVSLLVGAGIVIGIAATVSLSRFVAALLYGVEPNDPATLVAAGVILAVAGALATWLPARRASRIDPVEVLREV